MVICCKFHQKAGFPVSNTYFYFFNLFNIAFLIVQIFSYSFKTGPETFPRNLFFAIFGQY